MASFEEIQKAKIAASFNLDPAPGELLKSEIDELEKGGKRAVIGEKRTFSGREYIKTNDGWKFHGKGGGAQAQQHAQNALDYHVESKTHRDATDHLVDDNGKHFIDTLDPETGEKKFKPGDKVHYTDEGGTKHKGIISNREHSDGDMFEVDKDGEKKELKEEITRELIDFLDNHDFSEYEAKDSDYLSDKIHNYAENIGIEFTDKEAVNLAKQYYKIKYDN